MPNEEHLDRLLKGVDGWNQWRNEDPDTKPDLRKANLRKMNLTQVDLREADLTEAILTDTMLRNGNFYAAVLDGADLCRAKIFEADLGNTSFIGANLSEASLSGSSLHRSNLSGANLSGANLRNADLADAYLCGADFSEADLVQLDFTGKNLSEVKMCCADLRGASFLDADLTGANLSGANLSCVSFVRTKLAGALLNGCCVFGTSAWDLETDEYTEQRELVITRDFQSEVAVDNLKIAQFMNLLLNNEEIRDVLDTVISKAVLILGRFSEERKRVLDAIRDELRQRGYVPILFDFSKPARRDLTETVSTLAHMARFVIADITDAKSIPQELRTIVPNIPSLPIRPIILEGQFEWGMFKDFGAFNNVLPLYRYKGIEHLIDSLETEVIGPALNKANEIEERRKEFEQALVTEQ